MKGVSAAQALADKIQSYEQLVSDEEKIDYAFKLCTRSPQTPKKWTSYVVF